MSGTLPGAQQPAEDRAVVRLEAGRHAAVAVRAVELDGWVAARVPRVSPAVAVAVVHVVRLPGVGRQDDELALQAGSGRAQHERREADAPVVGRQLGRVEAGRPGAGLDGDRGRRRPLAGPVDRHRVALRARPPSRRCARCSSYSAPQWRNCRRQRTRVGQDPELHRLAGQVRAPQERGLDAEHADDGRLLLGDRRRALAAEDRRAGSLAGDRQPHHVRAHGRRDVGRPGQRVRAWREARLGLPGDARRRAGPCGPPRASRSRRD